MMPVERAVPVVVSAALDYLAHLHRPEGVYNTSHLQLRRAYIIAASVGQTGGKAVDAAITSYFEARP